MGNIILTCNVSQLKRAISMFKPINEEAFFSFNVDGLKIWAVDEASTVAFEMWADKSSFISYLCEEPKTFCIKIETITKSLTRFSEDEHLRMTIPDKAVSMRVNIFKRGGKQLVSSNREFTFPMITPDKEYRESKMNHPYTFKIVSSLWKTAVTDMGVSSKDMTGSFLIFIKKDRIRFQAGGAGEAKTKVEYHKSELREINIGEVESLTLDFSLDKVYELFRSMPDDLLLDFSLLDNQKPLICKFELSDIKLAALSFSKPFTFKMIICPYIRNDPIEKDELEELDMQTGKEISIPELDEIEDKNAPKDQGLKLDD